MIIAQISDTHIALDTPDADRRMRDLACTIADINALDPLPDAIVHTGDITQNGRPGEYARAVAALTAARAPVYAVAGNRDERANLHRAFSPFGYLRPDPGFIDYAVERHPVRLVVLDTLSSRGRKGDFCCTRVARLIDLIDAETTKPIAVFTHHPPFEVAVGPDRLHFETPAAMAMLAEALQQRSERVVAVFSGHVHRATTGRVGHIPASVMPCIATTLRYGEYPVGMKARPVYHLHRFDPACGFVSETRLVGSGPSARAADVDKRHGLGEVRREQAR